MGDLDNGAAVPPPACGRTGRARWRTPLAAVLSAGLAAAALLGGAALAPVAATPVALPLVGQLDPFAGNNRYADVWGEGNYAYIGSFDGSGVGIIDISVPSAPSLVAHYQPASGGEFNDLKVHNGIGYFASDDGGGVHIVDLSNPAAPVLSSQITAAQNGFDHIHNVFYDGGFLYQADNDSTIVKVFDVTDSTAPVFVRDIDVGGPGSSHVHDITVLDSRMYASDQGGMTRVYDVAGIGSTAPTLLGAVPTGAHSHSSWVTDDGNHLVSVQEDDGAVVSIFDISDLSAPVLASTISAAGIGIDAISPHNPIVVGDLLFVSWYQAGLQVFNIADPANPLYVGVFDTFPGGTGEPGSVGGYDGNWGVYPFLGLDTVLLSDMDGGLFIVDASALVAAPEPAALAIFLFGLAGLAIARRRRRS